MYIENDVCASHSSCTGSQLQYAGATCINTPTVAIYRLLDAIYVYIEREKASLSAYAGSLLQYEGATCKCRLTVAIHRLTVAIYA